MFCAFLLRNEMIVLGWHWGSGGSTGEGSKVLIKGFKLPVLGPWARPLTLSAQPKSEVGKSCNEQSSSPAPLVSLDPLGTNLEQIQRTNWKLTLLGP